MKVCILITIPDKEFEKSCTLTLDTVRVGFPNTLADSVIVYHNHLGQSIDDKLVNKCWDRGFAYHSQYKVHHAEWIKRMIEENDEPIVLLDGDLIFWEDCSGFATKELIAGSYIPLIWNDFAKCVSLPRLHTSFLIIPDPKTLRNALKYAYPYSHMEAGEYCPCDPYHPRIGFMGKSPVFYDTCCNLYQMVGGQGFSTGQKSKYTHLNSSSFYKVMYDRLENKMGFAMLHKNFVQHPESLRHLNYLVDDYYQLKHEEAMATDIGKNLADFLTTRLS